MPSLFSHVRSDLASSLVVFLIAVPLSLGIALASGAPMMAGLVAAAVGGIVAGCLGGAPLQVSGPAAGLTVLVFGLVQQFGWAVTCAATVCAGLLQLAFGWARVSRAALMISPAVVHGMLAGIGVVITLAQLHVVLGGTPQSSALANIEALPQQIVDHHGPAVVLGLLTIGILIAWEYLPAAIRRIPGPLVAVTTATVVSLVFKMPVKRIDLPDHLLAEHIFLQWPDSQQFGAFAFAVVSIALIASVESLLSAVATDRMHNGPRADLDRELRAQGIANTLSGILGGLPVTGVIVRSSANIRAGAKTRLSSILHGDWIVLFATLLSFIIDDIPLAALAGLLVVIGVKLVKLEQMTQLSSHRELPIYLATVLGVVFVNLLFGVGLGVVLASLGLLRRLARAKVQVVQLEGKWRVRVEGSLTFLAVPTLTRALAEVPQGATVEVDLMVDLMDHAAFEALHTWRDNHERAGGRVDIDERHESWYQSAADGAPRANKSSPLATYAALLTGRRARSPLNEKLREFMQTESVRPALARLAKGQSPAELFITCSDSRVVPTLMTLSGPGDLFVVRNVGNFVPALDPSVGSAVEYALNVLQVERIIVCGHSGCGAMNALLNPPVNCSHDLEQWLRHGRESLDSFRRGERVTALSEVDALSQVNVVQQLKNLRARTDVRQRIEQGKLELVGLFFDIQRAQVQVLDPLSESFQVLLAAAA